MTDSAIGEFKPLPILSFDQRKSILENIKGVTKVIAQEEWDYSENLRSLKPDFMVHGDDWLEGTMSRVRENCIEVLGQYGGQLIEVAYTRGVSSTRLAKDLHLNRASPSQRQKMLRRLIQSKKIVRIMEAHSPISAIISENIIFDELSIKKISSTRLRIFSDRTISLNLSGAE